MMHFTRPVEDRPSVIMRSTISARLAKAVLRAVGGLSALGCVLLAFSHSAAAHL